MPWLLLLHMMALICWCGSLLYLPAMIFSNAQTTLLNPATAVPDHLRSMPRAVFNLIATPAALLAIGSGTAVFLVYGIIELWLLMKLALVALLVLGHILTGWLVVQAEKRTVQHTHLWCTMLAGVLSLLMLSIVTLVLFKPLQVH